MKQFFKTITTKIHKSKMLSLGFIVAVLGAIQMYLPEIRDYLDPQVYGIVTFVVGALIVVFRYLTTQPLEEK